VCRREDDLVAAVDRIGQLDRQICRTAAEERFSVTRMAADYERVYVALQTAGSTWRRPPAA
jgi:hypothetical protein